MPVGLRAITVVALSEAEGDDSSGAPLPSERCKKYLKAQIAQDSIIIPDEQTEESERVESVDEIQTDLFKSIASLLVIFPSLREICGFVPFVGSDAATNILPADGDAVENWRGLAVPPKKRKRTSSLSSCTEWLHADETVLLMHFFSAYVVPSVTAQHFKMLF